MPEQPAITIPVQGIASDVDAAILIELPSITCPITGCGWKIDPDMPKTSADLLEDGPVAFEARLHHLSWLDRQTSTHWNSHQAAEYVAELAKRDSIIRGLTTTLRELPELVRTAAIQTG